MRKILTTALTFASTLYGYTQCGPANIAVTDYCNNQYAEFNINDTDPDTRYQWFSDAAGANSLGYGPNADGKYFYSPTTYSTGDGPQDFWYQKQVSGVTGGPQSSTFTGATSGNFAGRTNPILVDADFDFTLNSITIPFHSWGAPAAGNYGVKIKMDGTTANWFYFTEASLVAGGTNIWFLTIPIDINGLGQGIPVTAGTGIEIQAFSESDGTEAAGTQFLDFAVISSGLNNTYTIGNPGSQLTIHQDSNESTSWPAGKFGFFDWDITMKCPLQQITANEEADLSKCCVPVTDQPNIITSTGSDIYELPVVGSLTASNANAGHYFKWFKDGALFSEGVGQNTINITDIGKYTVKVAEKAVDIDKQSCGTVSKIKKIREKKLFIAPSDTQAICLGDAVALSSTGGLSDWLWTTTGGGNVDNPNSANTSWTPNAEGTFKVVIEAMVPEGELVINGDFEDGATGFDVSSKMREAPWGDVTIQNVPGCGNGPNLVFRNYGISGNGNGVYTVGNTAPLQDVWCFNGGVKDHTTGNGNFFMMDGLTEPGWNDLGFTDNYIWQQKVVVEKNVDYEFSAWFASLDVGGPTPPKIKFFIDGQEITITDGLTYSENWDQVLGTWNSGNYEGEITLSILNATNADGGNDFAMDDISFSSGNALQSDTTVVVVEECVDPCVKPTSVTIADDTLKICDQANFNHVAVVVEDPNPLDVYYYSWFKDGNEISAPNTSVTLNYGGIGDLVTSNGWYKIRVEDGNNGAEDCYLEDSIYLSVNPIPEPDLGNDTTICFGESLDLDAGPGPGPGISTYVWTPNGGTTQTITASTSGTYGVTITTSIGCEGTDEIDITINPEVITELGLPDTLCEGESKVLDAGGPWTSYAWLPGGETTQTINVTTTGDYIVEVQDGIGCSDTDTVHVEVYEVPIVDLGPDITRCEGPVGLDAGVSVVGQTYLWNTNEATQTINVNSNGTNEYSVTVSNWECEDSDTILVTIDSVLNVNFGPDTTVCEYDLPVELLADPGFDSYNWMDNSNSPLGTGISYTALAAGEYRVEVVDPTGCRGYDTINVLTNPRPDATINNGIDTITICPTSPAVNMTAAEAGANYSWTPNGEATQAISTQTQGWYSVEVSLNGCVDEDSIYLEVADELLVDIGPDQTVCPNVEAVFFTSFPGYNHDWNNGASNLDTFKTTTDGMVTVYVTDPGGCEGRDTAYVTIQNPLKIDLGADQEICVNHDSVSFGMISDRKDVAVVGWNDGSTDWILNTVTDGEYWLEVDSAGCLASDTVLLTVHSLPIVDLGPDTFICKGTGETIPLDAGAGFVSYLWSGTGSGVTQNIVATDSGEYIVTVTDLNGCVNSDSMYIDQKEATLFELFGGKNDTTICPLGSALINLPLEIQNSNNPVWTWTLDALTSNGNNVLVENRADGDQVGVHLSLINEFGCLSEDTFTVLVKNQLNIDLADQEVCEGGSVVFDSKYPSNGYVFEWNGDPLLDGNTWLVTKAQTNQSGPVSISIVSAEGCLGDTTVALTVHPNPVPVLSDVSICEGDSATFDPGVNNAFSVVWGPGGEKSNVITLNSSTNLTVTITDVNGCTGDTSATLTVNPKPEFTITQFPDAACEGEEITLNSGLDAGYSHMWTPSGETTSEISVTQNGTYGVTITNDQTSCSEKGEREVTFIPYAEAVITPGQDTVHLCEGETATLTANITPYEITWRNEPDGESFTTQNVTTNISSKYILNVNNQGCDDEDTIYVDVHPLPEAPLGADTIVCFLEDDSVVIDAGRNAQSYLWNTGQTGSTIKVGAQGTYMVELINQWGCEVEDAIFVDDDCPSGVFLPNAFTPNGDGMNDTWIIQGHNLLSVEVMVFDRWGMHIWTGNALGAFWDGTFMGREVQIDVYVWKMKWSYEDNDERIVEKSRVGTVSVIK